MVTLVMAMTALCSYAQHKPQVEAMCGVDLYYRDVNFMRLYDVLLNLTPAVKWHMGRDWLFSGQMYIPVVDQGYGKKYMRVRLGLASLAKQLHLPGNQHFKLSAGFFAGSRYGLDARWMFPVNSWLMLQARAGYTGYWTMVGNSTVEKPDLITGTIGANLYMAKWNTELRVQGGRYIYEDWGMEGNIFRHFPHTSVGLFARYHESSSTWRVKPHKFTGGFKIIIMLPPYKKSDKKFRARLISNFNTTWIAQSDEYSMSTYYTDPEENDRTNAIDVEWGTGTLDKYNHAFSE